MRLVHLAQALLSGYGAYHSYRAITNLSTYEATTKKLAKWSDEVAHQLHKTRTTQATGAVTVRSNQSSSPQSQPPELQLTTTIKQILISTLTSLTLAFAPDSLPRSVVYASPPCLVIIVLLARSHLQNYWAPQDGKTVGQVKVDLPNMKEYNEAQRATEQVLQVLQWVEWSWVGASLGAGVVGYGN